MRATLLPACLALLFAAAGKPVAADDPLDEAKRAKKIAADKFEAELKDAVAEADKSAKVNRAEAVAILERVQTFLAINRDLSEERRREWSDLIDFRVKAIRQAAAARLSPAELEDRRRILASRNREVEERNAELKDYYGKIASMKNKGEYREIAELSERMRQKNPNNPNNPAFAASKRYSQAAESLKELRGIRDEKSARYVRVWTEFMRSTIPIEGDIEFPKDWKEKTKRRTEVKLTPEEKTLLEALSRSVTMEVKAQPIQAVIDELERRYKIKFDLDKVALDQLQLSSETAVTVNAKGQSLRSVLKKMFGDVGLTYTIRKGELRVTTPQRAADDMVIRAYSIADLIQPLNFGFDPYGYNQLQTAQSIASIITMIQGIDPGSWDVGGGKGTIVFEPRTMSILVKQSAEMQFTLQGALK